MTSTGSGKGIWALFGDWDLRHCARHGHVTYQPTDLDETGQLSGMTQLGEVWRCLRCGVFVLGAPMGAGPADEAPEVPRGALLRDLWLMRVLAVERAVKALLLFVASFVVVQFRGSQGSFADVVARELPLLRPAGAIIGWDIDRSWAVKALEELSKVNQGTLTWIAVGLAAYGCVQVGESIGLWLMKRWGEYLAAVATSAFIPLEIYELCAHPTPWKVAAIVLNVVIVFWLVWSKYLFGVRGGGVAFHARHAQESLLTVQRSLR